MYQDDQVEKVFEENYTNSKLVKYNFYLKQKLSKINELLLLTLFFWLYLQTKVFFKLQLC